MVASSPAPAEVSGSPEASTHRSPNKLRNFGKAALAGIAVVALGLGVKFGYDKFEEYGRGVAAAASAKAERALLTAQRLDGVYAGGECTVSMDAATELGDQTLQQGFPDNQYALLPEGGTGVINDANGEPVEIVFRVGETAYTASSANTACDRPLKATKPLKVDGIGSLAKLSEGQIVGKDTAGTAARFAGIPELPKA